MWLKSWNKSALIRRIQKEVRFAEFHLDEEKESMKVMDLKRQVLDLFGSISSLNEEVKRYKFLLDWVEQQRRELVGDNLSVEQKSGSRQFTKVDNSRALSSSRDTKASSVDRPAKTYARPRKPLTAKWVLDPVDPGKVIKTFNKRRSARRNTHAPRDVPQATKKTNVNSRTVEPKSEATMPIENEMYVQ